VNSLIQLYSPDDTQVTQKQFLRGAIVSVIMFLLNIHFVYEYAFSMRSYFNNKNQ